MSRVMLAALGIAGGDITATMTLATQVVAAALVGMRLARRVAPAAEQAVERLVVGLVASIAHVVVLLQLLGAVGLLRRGPVLIAQLVVLAAVLVWARVERLSPAPRRTPSPGALIAWGTGLGFLVLGGALSLQGASAEADTLQYHLPNAATWLRTGSLWDLPLVVPGTFTNTYPSNGELSGLWLMLGTHDDALAYLTPLVYGVLAVAGIALLVRELGGRAWIGALAAIAVVASPLSFWTQTNSLMVDLPAAAGFVTAVGLALVGRRTGQLRWSALAGVTLGLSVGSKYPALLPGVAALALMTIAARSGTRLRTLALACAGAAPLCAFWFVRTWWATGNPIFPQPVGFAGRTLFSGGTSPLNHYRTSMLEHVLDGNGTAITFWARSGRTLLGPVLVLAAVGAVQVLAVRRGDAARARTIRGVAWLALVAFVAYLATPFTGGGPDGTPFLISSQLRYALPAVLLAVGVGAAVLPARLAVACCIPALAYSLHEVLRGPGFRVDLHPSPFQVGAAVWGAALLLTGAVVRSRMATAPRPHRRVQLAGAGVAAALALGGSSVAAVAAVPRPEVDPVTRILHAAGRPQGTVALVGPGSVRAVLGPTLGNQVVAPAAGGAAGEIPISDAEALDEALRVLQPAAIVVGPPGSVGVPPGWAPSPAWTDAGTVEGGQVFVPTPEPPCPPLSTPDAPTPLRDAASPCPP